jgi:hypothetical protein
MVAYLYVHTKIKQKDNQTVINVEMYTQMYNKLQICMYFMITCRVHKFSFYTDKLEVITDVNALYSIIK